MTAPLGAARTVRTSGWPRTVERPARPPAVPVAVAATLSVLAAMLCTLVVTRVPWLGLRIVPGGAGSTAPAVITTVHPGSPAETAGLRMGTRMLRVGALTVSAADLLEEPDVLDTWPQVDAFLARQRSLRATLGAPRVPVGVQDAAGAVREVTIAPRATRPVSSLPLAYWCQLFFGAIGCVTGTWLWALRRGDWGARAYAATGAWFLVFAYAAAVYSSRELALDGTVFRALGGVNHLGATMFGAALCSLFLSYPRRLGGPRVLAAVNLGFLAWWIANVTRVAPDQNWGSRFPVLAAMVGALLLVGVQWWRSRGDPASRAILRWFGASVLVGCGAFVGAQEAVKAWGATPAIPQGYAFGFFVLMYVGLAAGLRRHRLFDLDEWALRILFWGIAVAAIVALDVALLGTVLGGGAHVGAAGLLAALAALPARRWVWARLLRRRTVAPDRLVEGALGVAYAATAADRSQRWRALLADLFDPLAIVDADPAPIHAELDAEGTTLTVPAVAAAPALRLTLPGGGRRLFAPRDVRLAATLVRLMRTADASRDAFEEGVRRERTRIARGLHDTVSSPLLAGIAHAPRGGDGRLAREIQRAVDGMRTVVSGDAAQPAPLADCVADARFAAVERLTAHGIAVRWPLADLGLRVLAPGQRTAFAAFVQEAVTNVIRHAAAAAVDVHVAIEGDALVCAIVDDGRGPVAVGAVRAEPGQGLPNLYARAAALGGRATIGPRPEAPGFAVRLVVPVATLEASASPTEEPA